jgi:hypothetical protein
MSEPLDLDLDEETAAYAAAQVREYSKWEAAELITAGNAPAYNPGDPVPISNVERLGYAERGQVRPQLTYVEAHPEDDDVKTFLDYVSQYPDHPTAKAWEAYRSAKAAESDAAPAPPMTFGGKEKKAAKKAAPAKTTAADDSAATTAKKG